MTLGEMKKKVLTLIEEYDSTETELTADIDISAKLNLVINMIQNELARLKKIPAYDSMEVSVGDEIELTDEFKSFYQLNTIRGVGYEVIGNNVIFSTSGEARIYYYKYPKQITMETSNDYVFELSQDALEVMPYGVASDVLKADVSTQYGQMYATRYAELKQLLDPRYGFGSVSIEGGVEIG